MPLSPPPLRQELTEWGRRTVAGKSGGTHPAPQLNLVHLWWQDAAEISPAVLLRLQEYLTASEKQRCQSLRTSLLQREFLVSRALLRSVLAYYLGTAPASVVFTQTGTAKPEVTALTAMGLGFNQSRSSGLCLIAVAAGEGSRLLGVDVERERNEPNFWDAAQLSLVFSPRELTELIRLPLGARSHAFTAHWTRKEAVLKALGLGLKNSLAEVCLPTAAEVPALTPTLMHCAELSPAAFYLQSLALKSAEFAASLALFGASFSCRSCGDAAVLLR